MNQTLRIRTTRFSAVFFIFCSGTRRLASAFVADGLARWPSTLRSSYTTDARCHAAATPEASSGVPELAERIYELAGRRFDIGKPAVLAKVLFEEVHVVDPSAGVSSEKSGHGARKGRVKPRSVTSASLSAVLKVEPDPTKQELVTLVRQWLDVKTTIRRGGFKASGAKVADRPEWYSQLIPDDDRVPADPTALPLILVDGHNIIFRCFHAMPQLTAPDGTPVGAVVGFCNVMNKLILQHWPGSQEPRVRIVIAFDTGGKNFRHTIYPEYKAKRPEPPEDLRPQFALIRKACEAYSFEIASCEGFEADDVLATLALKAVNSGVTKVTIVSTDKDLAQLVTRRVNIFNCYTGETLGPDGVLDKYLAPPGRLADLLAIAGDKADGIKGAEGYGPINAAKVLVKHANLPEALEEMCDTLKTKKDPVMIEGMRSQVLMARRIISLRTDVPIDTIENHPFKLGGAAGTGHLLNFMRNLGMQNLLRKTSRICDLAEAANLGPLAVNES